MATEIPLEVSLPSLEGLTPTQARSVVLPHIIRFTTASPPPEHTHHIAVLVSPTRRSIIFIEGLFQEKGPLPASKSSIEEIPVVKVLNEGTNCIICLSEFEIGEEAKEMPCSHHFHSACIDKWLGINGSCPTCRYKMPVKEERVNKDEESGDDSVMEIEGDRVMFVFHVILRRDENLGPYITTISVSDLEVHRRSDDVLIDAGDGDQSEAREGDQSEARDSNEFEVGGDVPEAQDTITDNN